MKTLVVVSGTSSGIGESLVNQLLNHHPDTIVLSISRRLTEIQKGYQSRYQKRFHFFYCDLAKMNTNFRIGIVENLIVDVSKIVFINNAAVLTPIGVKLHDVKDEVYSINVNVKAAIILIKYFLKFIDHRLIKIINISSGAANKPIKGWGPYCAAKAYVSMYINVLRLEYSENKNVDFWSYDPGVVDTPMQEVIREQSADSFPNVSDFINFKYDNKLKSSDKVAQEIINYIYSV